MSRLLSLVRPGLYSAACFYLLAQTQPVSEQSSQVYAWGLGTSGQLGLGSEASRGLPTLIKELEAVQVLKVGSSGYCNASTALTRHGRIFTWGSGIDGILGVNEDDSNLLIPTLIERLPGHNFTKVVSGGGHMAALNSEGRLFTWGLDNDGQLGHQPEEKNTNSKFYKPTFFKGGKPPGPVAGPLAAKRVVDVDCGRYFSAAVTEEGEVYTWGAGRDFALGHGDRANKHSPTLVEGLAGEKVIKIACGKNFCVALSASGSVFSWGNNDLGQLGITKADRCKELPTKLTTLVDVVDVSAGDLHVLALTRSGQVYSWGNGADGQLGHANTANQFSPKLIQSVPQIAKVACGGGHSAFITADFSLLMCGRGRDGQLGRQARAENVAGPKTTPIAVDTFGGSKVLDVACGVDHTLAVTIPK